MRLDRGVSVNDSGVPVSHALRYYCSPGFYWLEEAAFKADLYSSLSVTLDLFEYTLHTGYYLDLGHLRGSATLAI